MNFPKKRRNTLIRTWKLSARIHKISSGFVNSSPECPGLCTLEGFFGFNLPILACLSIFIILTIQNIYFVFETDILNGKNAYAVFTTGILNAKNAYAVFTTGILNAKNTYAIFITGILNAKNTYAIFITDILNAKNAYAVFITDNLNNKNDYAAFTTVIRFKRHSMFKNN